MRRLYFSLASTLLFAAFAWATPALAATLSFDAPTTVSAGETFTLTVLVDTNDRGFNAAEATLTFPADMLEVTSIDTDPSATAFNFWITLPSFSNDKGTVRFSGGATRGLVGSAVQVLAVHMRAKGAGDALIIASDASVNASDGSGSNILTDINALRITVSPAQVTIPAKTQSQTEEHPSAINESPETAGNHTTSTILAQNTCGPLFKTCPIASPHIQSSSVTHQEGDGATILVSGTAQEGTFVRLKLTKGGVRYKQIEALVDSDRRWEGAFTDIYAYGAYAVEALAVTQDGRTSEQVIRGSIQYNPPHTIAIFDFVFRWYLIASVALGFATLASGWFLVRQIVNLHAQRRWIRAVLPSAGVFVILAVVFVGIVVWSYTLWMAEYINRAVVWKDTDIACIEIPHSLLETYSSAKLDIYIDGAAQNIPEEIGVSSSCVAQVHTHDATEYIHFQSLPDRPVRLGDFFKVAGTTLEQEGYSVTVTVNGEDYTDHIGSYALRNDDIIVVRYTTKHE